MYINSFKETALFKGFSEQEIVQSLACLDGYSQAYRKKEIIINKEERLHSIGVVLRGTLFMCKEDPMGMRFIFSELNAGAIVGETALHAGQQQTGYEITAATDCEVLFIRIDQIVRPGQVICSLRARIIENLVSLILHKNQELYDKLDIVTHKNLRNKILYYLQQQAKKNNSPSFTIPFSREELAYYLGVDRSALSRELSRMKAEGFLTYSRNAFRVLQSE
ncbi:Crp/Fnr family transcriptional regulator [Paenibacillus sp. HW567]|uniref:Crp/Fnr family transcriptional regulator n=1 Tax=Paenibacillus sp. HW567 TaxID=1034769 RepID=UPI0005637301|nr:Crp/Fnr family transcriptional regulator [Paenibacillus sp. HW567]